MKIIKSALAASSIFLLTACGEDNEKFNTQAAAAQEASKAASRVIFDPLAGKLSIPNDLLFKGSLDGTLEVPDEVDAKEAGETVDLGNPSIALGAVDGWSVQSPFQITFDLFEGASALDPATVNTDVVKLIEVDAENPANTRALLPAEYTVIGQGAAITIFPNLPLKQGTQYIIAVLKGIKDDAGHLAAGSTFYELSTQPGNVDLGPALTSLQGIINDMEAVVTAVTGTADDNILYTASMTTVSTGNEFAAIKSAVAQNLAAAAEAGTPLLTITATGLTVKDVLAPTIGAAADSFIIADFHQGSIAVPYYLQLPSAENPLAPIKTAWTAMCDSGALLAQTSAETLNAATPGVNDTACQALGLRDLGLDAERYITKYNPMPQKNGDIALDVLVTVPNAMSGHLEEPAAGWPVVIINHGLAGKKEDMLLLTAALSKAGFATVAIDMPLHGSRGFNIDGLEGDEINATDDPTHFMNLAAILVARDNVRQSTADMLALRAALHAASGVKFNTNKVYMSGFSLGGIVTANTVAIANTPVDAQLDGLFTINAAGVHSGGGGLAGFLLESPSFGSTIKGTVLKGAGNELSTAFTDFIAANGASCSGDIACEYDLFESALTAGNDTTTLAYIASLFSQFQFAAQTILDAADPNTNAALIKAHGSKVLFTEIIGCADETSCTLKAVDNVIIPQSTITPYGGTQPLTRAMGLTQATTLTMAGSSVVSFIAGHHGSLLSPGDDVDHATVLNEHQSILAQFLASDGAGFTFTNPGAALVNKNGNPATIDTINTIE